MNPLTVGGGVDRLQVRPPPLTKRLPEQVHLWVAAGVFCFAAAGGGLYLDPRFLTAAGVGAVILIGLPHGQFDWRAARARLVPRLGRCWLLAFLAAYLGLAAVAPTLWIFLPMGGFLLFLACLNPALRRGGFASRRRRQSAAGCTRARYPRVCALRAAKCDARA